MASVTRYPLNSGYNKIYKGTTGWTNHTNIKANNNNYAYSSISKTKKYSPQALFAWNFSFGIPLYAKINSITPTIQQARGAAYRTSTKPKVYLALGSTSSSAFASANIALQTTTWTNRAVTFKNSISPSQINGLQVRVKYGAHNGGSYDGYCRSMVRRVYVTVNYTLPTFTLKSSVDKISSSLGSDFLFKLDLSNVNKVIPAGQNPQVTVTLPSSISFQQIEEGSGSVNYDSSTNTLVWSSELENYSDTITLRLRGETVTETATISSTITNMLSEATIPIASSSIKITKPSYTFTSNIKKYGTTNEEIEYDIVVKSDSPYDEYINTEEEQQLTIRDFIITNPSNFTNTILTTENGTITDNVWSAKFNNDLTATLHVKTTPVLSPNERVTVTSQSIARDENEPSSKTFTYVILDGQLISLPTTKYQLSNTILDRLENGEEYYFTVYAKITDTSNTIQDLEKNLRVVFNNFDEDGISSENCIWSEHITTLDTFTKIQIPFTYNSDYPITIFFTGQYEEFMDIEACSLIFSEPQIDPKFEYEKLNHKNNFPLPVHNIITETNNSYINIAPLEETPHLVFKVDWLDIQEIDNFLIQGIQIKADVDFVSGDSVIVYFKVSDNNESTSKSIILNEFNQTLKTGGKFDFWELSTYDFDLEKLKFELYISNPNNSISELYLKNLLVSIFYKENTNCETGFSINNTHSDIFNVFLTDWVANPGTKNNLKYSQMDGSDENFAYRTSIAQDEISLTFLIQGEDKEESLMYLEAFSDLLQNNKNYQNTPILNSIILDDLPDRQYKYILEEKIEAKHTYGSFECTAKLKIVNGIGEYLVDTVTGNIGNYEGVKKTPAIIQLIVTANDNIELTEQENNQSMKLYRMTDEATPQSLFSVGDIITINSNTRQITVNNTAYDKSRIDYDSDWFILDGKYNFICENATVQLVKFREYR